MANQEGIPELPVVARDHSLAITEAALPAPRLQLRWEGGEERGRFSDFHGQEIIEREWRCYYELVLPLDRYDIRAEVWKDGEDTGVRVSELVVSLTSKEGGFTKRGATREPCLTGDGKRFADAPFRDGAHSYWDALALGGLPRFVIAPGGAAFPLKNGEA